MKARNLLFVFPSAAAGGIATGLLGMLRHFPREQFRPIAVTLSPGPVLALFRQQRIPCWVAPKRRPVIYLRHLIRQEEIHLVQSCDSATAGACAARASRLPHIWYLGSSLPALLPWLNLLSDAVVVQSRWLARQLEPHVDRRKLRIIPWGVSIPLASRKKPAGWIKQRLGMKPQDPLIAMVGNFYPAKRHLDFIRAARRIHQRLPQVRFLIAAQTVGNTPGARRASRGVRRRTLEAIARSGLRHVIFCDSFPAEQREDWYRQINLLLIPSAEGMGQAMLEAGIQGVPVVAANIGGAPEVIRDGRSGLLVPYSDSHALAQAALRIVENPLLGEKLGLSLKNHLFSHLGAESQARRFERLYESFP